MYYNCSDIPSCAVGPKSVSESAEVLWDFFFFFPAAKFVNEEDLDDVLGEFDAVIEDFKSPVEKRHFRYDEHLKTMKRRSSASVSDSGISDSESKSVRSLVMKRRVTGETVGFWTVPCQICQRVVTFEYVVPFIPIHGIKI